MPIMSKTNKAKSQYKWVETTLIIVFAALLTVLAGLIVHHIKSENLDSRQIHVEISETKLKTPTNPTPEASALEQEKALDTVENETPAVVETVKEEQPLDTCHSWMKQAGITDPDTAYILIMKESSCNPNAVNKSSGACGIGQQLPCGKWEHQWNDPVGGMIDMQNYVIRRYGSWKNALNHHLQHNWY